MCKNMISNKKGIIDTIYNKNKEIWKKVISLRT